MGTIAQKLEYLNDTRLLLKDNINKINNVLDDNSTFRSYPQELFNGYLDILNNGTDTLWNNLEKVSASGEEATLENVETAPIKMVLNGNTSQDTTTGKNLFTTDYLTSNSFTTYTKLTDNSFSFTATGTWKKASYKVPCKPNTNYYFNFSSTSSMYIQIRGVQTGTQIIAVYQAYLTTFNSGENTELQINIDIGQNSIASGTISDIQLEEGTTATSFEKYTGGQPSPSPDYPQEVKVVKGENVVSVQGKNLLPISSNVTQYGITSVKNEDGSISFSGIATSTYCYITNRTPVELPIGYYAFSINKAVNYGVRLQLEFEDGTTGNVLTIATGRTSVGGTTSKIVKAIRIYLISLTSGTEYNDTLYLQLEKGSTATPYVPYSKTDYPINLGDIELCKINTYKDYFHKDSGKWYVHKEIGKKIVDENSNVAAYSSPRFRVYVANSVSPSATEKADILCDKLKTVTKNALASVDNVISGSDSGRTGEMLVRINAEINTLDLFKQFLAENNLTIYYHLATPTETEITNTTLIEQLEAISKAKSVKDKTYITQTNEELPFILDVEAIKEYEVN